MFSLSERFEVTQIEEIKLSIVLDLFLKKFFLTSLRTLDQNFSSTVLKLFVSLDYLKLDLKT